MNYLPSQIKGFFNVLVAIIFLVHCIAFSDDFPQHKFICINFMPSHAFHVF